MKPSAIKVFTAIIYCFITFSASAGDRGNGPVSDNFHPVADYLDFYLSIANNHLWRGIEVSDGLVMCTSLSAHDRNSIVNFGLWNGTNTTGTYKEFNFFLEFSMRRFKLAFWDTYNFSPGADYNNKEFFNYNARTTGRFLDCILSYNFGPGFPLSLTWSTIIFGRDRYDLYSAGSKNRYTTYVEGAYRCLDRQGWTVDTSVGGTFTMSHKAGDRSTFYSEKPGIIDVRAKVTYSVKITDSYHLPVSATALFNPVENRAYFQIAAQVFSF